jgi:hypothetical protein
MVHLSQLPRSRPRCMERISLFSRSTVQPRNSTRIDTARQRAEALFKPKPLPKALCANETANKMAHQPRVLSISALMPASADNPCAADDNGSRSSALPPDTSSSEIRYDSTADRRNLWGFGFRDPAHSPKSQTGCSCRGMIYRRGAGSLRGPLQSRLRYSSRSGTLRDPRTRAVTPGRVGSD